MALDEIIISRLSFIKYLFTTGIRQSYTAPPLSSISLLSFHDSVELFLQLASEHLDSGSKQPNFMDYWDILSKKLGTEISQRESMRRLNKARVSIKHHGTLPSQIDIEAFRESTINFFEYNCPIIFGLPLEKISLIGLVKPPNVRDKLKVAEEKIAKDETLTALDDVAIAFNELLLNYDKTHRGKHGESLFNIRGFNVPSMSFRSGDFSDQERALNEKIENIRDYVDDTFDAMRRVFKIIVLGLDYVKYVKFLQMTPQVHRSVTGKYFINRLHSENNPPSVEMVQFCIDYTIEAAIQIDHVR